MRGMLVVMSLVLVVGCDPMSGWFDDGSVTCGDRQVNIKSDARSCGDCPGRGAVCAEGVACVDWFCDYTSVLHCGAKDRVCMGGESAACIHVAGGAERALAGPVVNGYACADVAVGEGGEPPVGEPPVVGEPPGGEPAVGEPPVGEMPVGGASVPQWMFVPGQSAACRGGDPRRCHHAWVEFTDVCGEDCGRLPFDYDFRVMTTEMSRAHYRDAVCDCGRIRTEQCADVCNPDRAGDDAWPMTGLNWCMAQAACEAVGGRLPTALEVARLEQVVEAQIGSARSAELFHGGGCGLWRDVVGSEPRVAECVASGAMAPGVARVDDPAGAIVIGEGVVPRPMALHNLLGNVGEWQLGEAGAQRCGQLASEETVRIPRAMEGLRTVQGRSAVSPMGESANRLVTVAASTATVDLGVRCVRAEGGPVEVEADFWGRCSSGVPLGLSPVRRASGERIYRAVGACVDSRAPWADGADNLTILEAAMTSETTPLVWRDVDVPQIGQVWFTPDAQWWIGKPALPDNAMTLEVTPLQVLAVEWSAMTTVVTGPCVDALQAAHPVLMRQLDFLLSRDQLGLALPDIANPETAACAHFVCDATIESDACETTCPAWRLPMVVAFEHAEQFNYPGLCW